MERIETDPPAPGPGEALVRVRACALNYRDQLMVQGRYGGKPIEADAVPLSDGAGEIAALGPGASRFNVGERVASTFFLDWREGPPTAAKVARPLGAPPAPGMLAEYVALPETALVHCAQSLSFEEAACLPCAGVTTWNALMAGLTAAGAGRTVLVLGAGGVSMLALKLALGAGARVIATSSSEAKLERIRALGAAATINYRATPEWGAEAARLAGGGVDHVIEVGGAGTLGQSLQAVGYGGEIALIGVLSPQGAPDPRPLMRKGATLRGVYVGSAAMAEALGAFVDAHAVKPVIGATFGFDEAKAAYAHGASAELFGKVVIAID